MNRIIFHIFFLLSLPGSDTYVFFAQSNSLSELRVGSNLHHGFLLPEYGFIRFLTNSSVDAFEIEVEKTVSGKQLWHKVYGFPEVGFSGMFSKLGNDQIFGKAFTINPFITFHLIRGEYISLKYKIGLGTAYISKRFDPDVNYRNLPIGSHLNIYFNSELWLRYQISNHFEAKSGIAFYHFSNANLAEPNIGLNYLTGFIGFDMLLNKNIQHDDKQIPQFIKHFEYMMGIGGCAKKTRRFAPETYFAGSLSLEARWYLFHKFGAGAGFDLFYDSSIPDEMKLNGITDPSSVAQFKTGIHLSQELTVGKLSLIIEEGCYFGLVDQLEHKRLYNRGIVRYKFDSGLFLNLAMKSNLFVLDVMELGAGYWIKCKNKMLYNDAL